MLKKLTIVAFVFILAISYADVGDDVEKTYNKAKDSVKDAATTYVGAQV